MPDLTGMLDESQDLETRLEAASYLLKQAAEEEGVDLNDYSEDDVAEMLTDIVEGDEDDGDEEDDEDDDGNKVASAGPTVADVALEITKRAAAEGVDLSEFDADEYAQVYNKVAQEMSDPYYWGESQKLASQAAQMDELGRIAARGFVDEINKLASDEDDEDLHLKIAAAKAKGIVKNLKRHGGRAVDAVKGFGKKVKDTESSLAGRLGRSLRHGTVGKTFKGKKETDAQWRATKKRVAKRDRLIGRAAGYGGAGAAAAGGYAATRD